LLKTALKAIENEAKAIKNGHNVVEATKLSESTEQKSIQDNDRLKPLREKVGSRIEGDKRKTEGGKAANAAAIAAATTAAAAAAAAAADSKSELLKPKLGEERGGKTEVNPQSRVASEPPKGNNRDYQLVECENGAVKRKQKKKKKKSDRPSCMSSTKVVTDSTTPANNELKSKKKKRM